MLNRVVKAIIGEPSTRTVRKYQSRVDEINVLEPEIEKLSHEEILERVKQLRQQVADGEELDNLLNEAFALVREASKRTTGLRHYDVQMIGGIVLHEGKIAEMRTGEGKTLVATLPLFLNGLTGRGAHLVTPNDYLSKVGLQQMGPIYHYLGMSAGVIQSSAQQRGSFLYDPDYHSNDDRYEHLRPVTRREAYQADVTYGTNNEFGFDYLRDNMVRRKEQMTQRGHHYAIVDEVDNILIDEARTPLIISGTAAQPSSLYQLFNKIVQPLKRSSDESVELEDPDGDYIHDVKTKNVYLTEQGVEKVEQAFSKTGEMQGDNLYGPENADVIPYLDNALRANVVYERDKDYIVDNGQVVIVDEFTGRLMHGRRFSEGLHQAIEAKEGVEVQRENMTLGTITFQNYFRMYDKLAGMTGTAYTSLQEFRQIYDLDVIVIPTHKPVIRDDYQDKIFTTHEAKFNALIEDIRERQENGQPVLVGTVAVEASEYLSKKLKKAGVRHEVLNAKQHFREATIIAQAGRPGSVTIATNMAGRGVDILLGGNPEGIAREKLQSEGIEVTEATPEQWQAALAEGKKQAAEDREKVLAAGGLYVLGTERHDARRIDNQLRGRSGRQGDPGASRFYLSLEDELMKRFGAHRVKKFMEWGLPPDQPIEHNLISKSIAQAQDRVEGYYFDIRKRVLEYDDVVDRQRTAIYRQRREILDAESKELRDKIQGFIAEEIHTLCETLPEERLDWDLEELYRQALTIYPVPAGITPKTLATAQHQEDVEVMLVKGALEAYDAKIEELGGEEVMTDAEKQITLQTIDRLWQRHLTDLDVLREGIGLQAIRQRDPVVEYKISAYNMWEELQDEIQSTIVRNIYRIALVKQQQPQVSNIQERQQMIASGGGNGKSKPEPARATSKSKIGRNDPCWCGSGKKYKHCHYRQDVEERQLAR
jgi:preprotein translocase subunit SecA